MRIAQTKPLFAWDCLEDSPSLKTIRELLAVVPDARLLESLRQARGKGRNDYSVRVLWGVVVLIIALRHADTEACLGELRRNEGLRRLLGIETEDGVPSKWNMSRFEETLGREPHRSLLGEVFHVMIERLGTVVPDLGRETAGDATGLSARRTKSSLSETEAAEGLPQASGGRKEYTDEAGHVTNVVEWFGFKLHLLVDVKHEVALSYEVTDTKAGDGETLPVILTQARSRLPEGRLRTLVYDKAADSNDVYETLAQAGVSPVVENRSLWESEHERRLPCSNVVHDEAGTLYCYDQVSDPPVRHPMAYIGHEPQRGTLKYRCPAKHQGWECPMSDVCNAGKTYGMTVRVKRENDFRRFPPIPRATKKFERLYKGRSAVERVNARLKLFWGADDGNVTGSWRFHAKVGTMMVVHAAFATILAAAPRREGPFSKQNLTPIAKALRAKLEAA